MEKGLKDPLSDLCNGALLTLKGLGYPHTALFLKRGRKLELLASRGRLSELKVTGGSLSRNMPSNAVFQLKSGRRLRGYVVLEKGDRVLSQGERELRQSKAISHAGAKRHFKKLLRDLERG